MREKQKYVFNQVHLLSVSPAAVYKYILRFTAKSIRSRYFHLAEKMVSIKPTDVVPSAAVKFFGAGTAACIADLVTFPLDTAKVRLQVRHVVFMVAVQTSAQSV